MVGESARMSTEPIAVREVDREWVHLLLLAKDAGISIEEIRQFLDHARGGYQVIRSLA